MLMLGILFAYKLIARGASQEQRERVKAFYDNVVKMMVFLAYLLYASLCQRLLLLYQYARPDALIPACGVPF